MKVVWLQTGLNARVPAPEHLYAAYASMGSDSYPVHQGDTLTAQTVGLPYARPVCIPYLGSTTYNYTCTRYS